MWRAPCRRGCGRRTQAKSSGRTRPARQSSMPRRRLRSPSGASTPRSPPPSRSRASPAPSTSAQHHGSNGCAGSAPAWGACWSRPARASRSMMAARRSWWRRRSPRGRTSRSPSGCGAYSPVMTLRCSPSRAISFMPRARRRQGSTAQPASPRSMPRHLPPMRVRTAAPPAIPRPAPSRSNGSAAAMPAFWLRLLRRRPRPPRRRRRLPTVPHRRR